MTRLKYLLVCLALSAMILPLGRIYAVPSDGFSQNGDGDWYDSFNIDRNYYAGPHGYLPRMAYETLGSNAEAAYNLGAQFKEQYSDASRRAEAILRWVQTWTEYGYDSDNVVRDGVPQDEWAWNADETASRINQNTGIKAIGDCEDLAFFCATIYTGAGIDAAVIDCPDHVGCLIWLPEYPNADHYWDLNDGRGPGWIWVESTGSTNPLGWTPPDYDGGNWNAYVLSATGSISGAPQALSPNSSGGITPPTTPPQPTEIPTDMLVLGLIAVVVVVVLAVAGSRRKKPRENYQYPPPPPPPPPEWE